MHQKLYLWQRVLPFGVIVFAIFIYEFTIMSNASNNINNSIKQAEILQFNAQFEGYANKNPGISLQDFATIYNFIAEWNRNNPSDIIKLNLNPGTTGENAALKDIEKQVKNSKNEYKIEKLLQIKDAELYYFEFESSDIGYNNDLDNPSCGRINEISMRMKKIQIQI